MRKETFLRLAGAAVVSVALVWGGRTAAQETKPLPMQETQKETAAKTPAHVDTSGRLSLFLHGEYGVGFREVSVQANGSELSISGGGGGGWGGGLGYGISSNFDLELNYGVQESVLVHPVALANGSFTRSYLLATVKRKFPISDTGQFKVGLGLGAYGGGKLDFDSYPHTTVDYKSAAGLHLTGEFERFIARNTSVQIGGKLYVVKYKADSVTVNGTPATVDSLDSDIKELDGSGIDAILAFRQYF